MTRQHTPAEDPYAHARCACGHFFEAGTPPGRPCQYAPEGCTCTDHKLKTIDGGE